MFNYERPDSEEPYQPPEEKEPRAVKLSAMRQNVVQQLIESLTPQDGSRALFTFAERKRWGLRGHRKWREPQPPRT